MVTASSQPGASPLARWSPRSRGFSGRATRIAMTADRKSTRLNSSHSSISYAVFCLKKKISLDSMQAPAWFHLAIMTADSGGDLDTSIDYWRRSVQISPRYSQGLAFMGLGHYWRGAYDSADFWADSAVNVDTTYLLARQTVALFFF